MGMKITVELDEYAIKDAITQYIVKDGNYKKMAPGNVELGTRKVQMEGYGGDPVSVTKFFAKAKVEKNEDA